MDDPRARISTGDAGSHRRQDAGSRRRQDAGSRQRRRHRILQGAHLRRQHGELTGYSFQIRLLGCGALRERQQRIGILLLRHLNVPQSRPDNCIRYEDWSRVRRRRCSDAIEIRRGEAAEVRQGEPIDARQSDLIEFRQREATETRQGIGGGGTNDDQGGQRHRDHRHPARGHLLCRLGLLVRLRFPGRCFGHLRSLRLSPVARFVPSPVSKDKRAIAVTNQPWLARACPPEFGSNHGLVWLMIG